MESLLQAYSRYARQCNESARAYRDKGKHAMAKQESLMANVWNMAGNMLEVELAKAENARRKNSEGV